MSMERLENYLNLLQLDQADTLPEQDLILLNEQVITYDSDEDVEGVLIAYLNIQLRSFAALVDPSEAVVKGGVETFARLAKLHEAFSHRGLFLDVVLLYLRQALASGLKLEAGKSLTTSIASWIQLPEESNALGLKVLAALTLLCLLDDEAHVLLALLKPSARLAKNPVLLGAGLNCLGQVLRQRVDSIAKGLPTLLEWIELAGRFDVVSAAQRRNIGYGVKVQLAALQPILKGSPFEVIVNEALNRFKASYATSANNRSKRAEPPNVPVDEDVANKEEQQYQKRLKPSAAFAKEEKCKLDIMKVPLPKVISLVLKSCKRLEASLTMTRLESWRPSSLPEEAPVISDDPRKRGAASGEKAKVFKEDPASFDYEEFSRFLGGSFDRFLDGAGRHGVDMSRFGSTRRKEWAQLVSKFACCVTEGLVEAQLIDYCVQDLAVRSGLLLIWLRFKWISSESEEYEQTFIRILGRMESVMELDSTSADLEAALGDLLAYAPGLELQSAVCMFFMRALGLADMQAPEEGEEEAERDAEKEALTFRLLLRVLKERPGYRAALASLIEELLVTSNRFVRDQAYKLCGQTISLEPVLTSVYTEAAVKNLLRGEAEDGENDDALALLLELVQNQLGLLSLLSPVYQTIPETRRNELKTKIPSLLQHAYEHDPESLGSLTSLIEQPDSHLVKDVIEALPSSVPVDETFFWRLLEAAEAHTIAPTALQGLCSKLVTLNMSKRFLPLLISADFEDKSTLGQLFFQLINGPASLLPGDIFVLVHQIESRVGLKKCIEASNVCFAQPQIWRPEILLASLESILHASSADMSDSNAGLPTTYMRSVLQALTLHPRALSTGIHALLASLITRRVWEEPMLWEGWLRVCKALLPGSVALILQLPMHWAQAALSALPEAKAPLKAYLEEQPAALRNRYLSLVE